MCRLIVLNNFVVSLQQKRRVVKFSSLSGNITLHYITLHSLHYITLHYFLYFTKENNSQLSLCRTWRRTGGTEL